MKNTPCEIIKDLIPLYVDDVCSEKSKGLIEEHIAECEECRKNLAALKGELPPMTVEAEEAEIQKSEVMFFKAVKNKLMIKKIASYIEFFRYN